MVDVFVIGVSFVVIDIDIVKDVGMVDFVMVVAAVVVSRC